MAAFEGRKFTYRITGPQSIDRLDPLIRELELPVVCYDADSSSRLEFVWETTCERELKDKHKEAKYLNKLSNTQVIESKSNLAFLQLSMDRKFLDTFVAGNAEEVGRWAARHWSGSSSGGNECSESDWWAVKASAGNGGKDIWIVNRDSYERAVSELPINDEYVIQRYVHRPLLHAGRKKFHFRCYSVLNADMSALVYGKAFILTAGLDFSYDDVDMKRHVTNLSVNKGFANHPGQIPCDLAREYPEIFASIKDIWRSLVSAAAPFMRYQASGDHFEFFGIDIIADQHGGCWLIEANRLPGLESSSNNRAEEDVFYNEMMRALLRIVLKRALPSLTPLPETERALSVEELNVHSASIRGGWEYVREASSSAEEYAAPTEVFKNLLRWKLFTKKNRSKVMCECN